jgi:hypothetical protein
MPETTPLPADPPGPIAIPASLSHLPVVAGLIVPWITLQTPDGRPLFGSIDAGRREWCLWQSRCQICAAALEHPTVLFAREQDLLRRRTAEPGLHPWCAHYCARACPMLAGRQRHYRRTDPDLPALLGLPQEAIRREDPAHTAARQAASAQTWFTVWVRGYRPVWDHATDALAASFADRPPLRVRRLTPLT